MDAEIISVGTEILMGSTINTDATEISKKLNELGINVYWHTVVGDNPGRLSQSIEIAKKRADLIVTSGGLGPTCDDLTKQTLAKAFGLELRHSEEAERRLRERFKSLAKEMPESNLQQVYLPEGSKIFYNNHGTAPGCAFEAEGVTVMMLPGPPRELVPMLEEYGVPYLKQFSDEQILSHTVCTFGRGESDIESSLRDYMNSLSNPTLAPYAKYAEVQLRVTAKAKSRDEAEKMMKPVIQKVQDTLGDVIYGIDVQSLENCIVSLLKQQGKTLAVAESCTGGLVAKRITDISGSSEVFLGGVTAYTGGSKTKFLGIPEGFILEHDVVSAKVASALAERVRKTLGSDFGIGITGLAGPNGDGVNPVGTIFVALSTKDRNYVRPLSLGGQSSRERNRVTAANHALDMLRRSLTGLEVVKI